MTRSYFPIITNFVASWLQSIFYRNRTFSTIVIDRNLWLCSRNGKIYIYTVDDFVNRRLPVRDRDYYVLLRNILQLIKTSVGED